jgi:hypothetical protein
MVCETLVATATLDYIYVRTVIHSDLSVLG